MLQVPDGGDHAAVLGHPAHGIRDIGGLVYRGHVDENDVGIELNQFDLPGPFNKSGDKVLSAVVILQVRRRISRRAFCWNRWERRDHGLYRDDYIAISFLTLWPQMRQKGCEIVLVKGRGNSDVAEFMICDKAHMAVDQREKDLRVDETGDLDH